MALSRRGRILAGSVAALVIVPPVALAAFPWGLLASRAQPVLSRAVGRTVTVGSAGRVDYFSFHPTVELRDVAIGQPAWQGSGTMARVAHARVRFAALPLLLGHVRPETLDLSGVRIALFRDAARRENWHGARKGGDGGTGLEHVVVPDGRFRLIDVARHMTIDAAFAIGPRGVAVDGGGRHRGQPLRLTLRGSPLVAGRPQEMRVEVASPLASLSARARLDRPLDLSAFTAQVAGRGTDLTWFDDIVQAGLFPTRPFALHAAVRRDEKRWHIQRLAGTIGRSRLTAALVVNHEGGRTHLEGSVKAATLDFDDFTSAAQRARGAAGARATGPRVIPATPIRLDHLARLGGTIRLDAARLLSAGSSPFRTLRTTVTLDHRRLVAAPLRTALTSGAIDGRAVVDDRGSRPTLTVDLVLSGARIERLFLPKGELAGPLAARIRLTGAGDTARAAMARAGGKVGIVVQGGDMRRDYAIFAGGDVLKSVGQLIGGSGDRRVPVRCMVGNFAARDGTLRPAPFILDSELLRADGTGTILLAGERIDLSLAGHARHPGLIQSTAPVRLFGTLSAPQVDIRPPRAQRKGKGGMFERIGFLLKGLKTRGEEGRAAVPAPVDCAGLARTALG